MDTILNLDVLNKAMKFLKDEQLNKVMRDSKNTMGMCWAITYAILDTKYEERFDEKNTAEEMVLIFNRVDEDVFFKGFQPKESVSGRGWWYPRNDYESRLEALYQMKQALLKTIKR